MTEPNSLPIKNNLKFAYTLSLIMTVTIIIVSLVGILIPDQVYKTDELLSAFYSNDILNLTLGLLLLLGSMWLTYKEKIIGLLSWPGVVLFHLYSYATYLFGIPFNVLFFPYLLIVTLSVLILILLMVSIDEGLVFNKLDNKVPVKAAGIILLVIAIIILVNQFVNMADALKNETEVNSIQKAQWIVDFIVISPFMIIGGFLMIKKKPIGYVVGTSLLLVVSMLFIGLIPIMIYQGITASADIDWIGILIVFVSGFITFVPLIMFYRGITGSNIVE